MRGSCVWLLATLTVALACGRVDFELRVPDARDDVTLTTLELAPPAFATTSPTYVDVPGGTLTIPPSPGQPWLLLVTARIGTSIVAYPGAQARYLVDGVERGIGGVDALDGYPGGWQHLYLLSGTDAPVSVSLQLRHLGGGTATLDRVRVIAVPLASSLAPVFASDDAPRLITSMTEIVATQLVVTPTAPGEHVILLLANTDESPGMSDVFTYWLDPDGAQWSEQLQTPREAPQSQLLVRRANLSGPTTLTLIGRTNSTIGGSTQYVRALALHVEQEATYADDIDLDYRATTSASPTVTAELLPSLGAAARYLVLGTARLDDDCGNAQPAVRQVYVSVDAAVELTEHSSPSCAYDSTYGYLGLLSQAPSRIAIEVASGPGAMRVQHRESAVLVLGVD